MRTKLFGVVSIYGVLIALAVLCAVILCQREGRRRGLPEDIGLDMALWAVPLGVVCARLYYVIFRWDYYAQNPVSILYFWQGGLAIYGGVIGGALGLYLLSRRRRISCLTLFDMAAPLVILGQAIGRWGNLFNGEAYGYPVQSAFWQFFPVAVQVDGVWHLATFFYESCWDLAGFIVLWRYRLRAARGGCVFPIPALVRRGAHYHRGLAHGQPDAGAHPGIAVAEPGAVPVRAGALLAGKTLPSSRKEVTSPPSLPRKTRPGVSAQPGKSAPPYRPWRICWYFCLAVCNSGCGAGLV